MVSNHLVLVLSTQVKSGNRPTGGYERVKAIPHEWQYVSWILVGALASMSEARVQYVTKTVPGEIDRQYRD